MSKITDHSEQYAQVRKSIDSGLKDRFQTRKALSKVLGICQSTLQKKLNDPGKLTLEELCTIADILGVPASEGLLWIYRKETV